MLGVVLLILLGLAALGGLIAWAILAERKRKRLLEEWATKRGLESYDAAGELSWLQQFEAWGPGYGHRCFDGYIGRVEGVAIRLFRHRSKTKSKDSENVHNFTVCVLEPPISAPRLRIKPENLFHKIADALGGEDIDFESDEFSRKFWVKCKDRKFAYDVIHPRTMEFLLQAPKLNWEWQGRRLVLFVSGALSPKRADPLLRDGLAFIGLLPSHLKNS